MADDSDSDSSFGDIPLCAPARPQHKESVVIKPPESESLEASTARREKEEAAKREAAEAKERAEAQERERARIAAEAEAAKRREAAEAPSEEAPPAVARGSRAPKRRDGKHESFDQKEKRSRKQRNECDWNQEEKRILRQTTDGYSLGY